MAWFQKEDSKIVISFVDLDNKLQNIEDPVILTGQSGEKIDYDLKKKISDLEGKGYVLEENQVDMGSNPTFKEGNQSYLITFKHGLRKVNPNHPLTKIGVENYEKPVTFTVKYENTPIPVKNNVQTINYYRTLTADKVTGKQVPDGKFDTDWKYEKEKFDDVEIPSLPGVHADFKKVQGPKPEDGDKTITVTYNPNAFLIPMDQDGNEIENVGPYQFATDENDPTALAKDQVIPDIQGYTHQQETISPENPDKDEYVTYDKVIKKDTAIVPAQGSAQNIGSSGKNESPVLAAKAVAIIDFIDLDKDGEEVTASGLLYGEVGDVINSLYSTEEPIKQLEKAGYVVAFNNFDGKGLPERKFQENNGVPQIYTVGLRHKDSENKAAAKSESKLEEKVASYKPEDVNVQDLDQVMAVVNNTMAILKDFMEKNKKELDK